MITRRTKKIKGGSSPTLKQEGPKFNIKFRYEDLNERQKKLLKGQYMEKFGGNNQTFYNRLVNNNLTTDETLFFASMFECRIEELYTQEPPKQASVYELVQKAKGGRPGKQESLKV